MPKIFFFLGYPTPEGHPPATNNPPGPLPQPNSPPHPCNIGPPIPPPTPPPHRPPIPTQIPPITGPGRDPAAGKTNHSIPPKTPPSCPPTQRAHTKEEKPATRAGTQPKVGETTPTPGPLFLFEGNHKANGAPHPPPTGFFLFYLPPIRVKNRIRHVSNPAELFSFCIKRYCYEIPIQALLYHHTNKKTALPLPRPDENVRNTTP